MTQRTVDKPQSGLSEYDKALITATYFGFTPMVAPSITKEDLELVKHCSDHPHYDAAEKAALIRHYLEANLASLPHPLALAYRRPAAKKRPAGYSLHFIGTSSALAEATLIRTALSMLAESGYEHLRVDLNCVGDKDSIGNYERELANFTRKYGADLPDNLKQSLREDSWNLFRLEDEPVIRLRAMAPSSLSFLSSQSRLYFKEVLEYIEALGLEFRLAPELVGDRHHSSHTIFAIKSTNADAPEEERGDLTVALGYRYSRLSRRAGLRKEMPMAAVSIFSTGEAERKIYKQLPKPKFYLVQLGPAAKVKSLSIIELLRSHRIPVHHLIGRDKLTVQLSSAESLRVSHLIIIGQKEALDGTATIRNVSTRAQDTIPLANLPQFLKNIRL